MKKKNIANNWGWGKVTFQSVKTATCDLWSQIFHKEETSENIEDYFERDIFAEEISDKITAEHNKSSSSYIFGISGLWGEGKTHLLFLLKKKLENNKFTIVWFSPWKYAHDKPALMRCFIRAINQKLPNFYPPLRKRINLSDFERDQNIFSLNIWWCLAFSLGIGALIYVLGQIVWVRDRLQEYKNFIVLILIPIFIGIFSKLGTLQKTTKAASAVDQFDERLNLILKRLNKNNKKIVVFVDDLDRVSGEEAKAVLDALRTFFDKRELTYVVTGDHRILEGQIEKELPANKDDDGRRFLKKIFNVYWRLPLPTKSQMKTFITDRIKDITLSSEEKEKIIGWLLKYFEYNPRNIERFLEIIEFNILSLERRKTALKGNQDETENLEQITEVLDNKLLLVRALMLQEGAYPLYEKIVKEPNILRSIEEKVDQKQEYADIIQNLKTELKDRQVQFLTEFLPEEPRFYINNGLAHRIFPFFRLASEVGLSDDRGISLQGFEDFLRSNNHQGIAQWLKLTKDIQTLASRSQQIIEGEGDLNIKKSFIQTIIQSIAEDPNIALVFLTTIIPTIDSSIKSFDENSRMEIVNQLIPVIDKIDKEKAEQFVKQLTFSQQPGDFNLILEDVGTNSKRILASWIVSYMGQDFWAGLDQFNLRKNHFTRSEMDIFQQQEDAVVANFIRGNDDQRNQSFEFLQLTPEGLNKIRGTIKSHYDNTDQAEKNRLTNLINSRYGKKSWRSQRAYRWIEQGS